MNNNIRISSFSKWIRHQLKAYDVRNPCWAKSRCWSLVVRVSVNQVRYSISHYFTMLKSFMSGMKWVICYYNLLSSEVSHEVKRFSNQCVIILDCFSMYIIQQQQSTRLPHTYRNTHSWHSKSYRELRELSYSVIKCCMRIGIHNSTQ